MTTDTAQIDSGELRRILAAVDDAIIAVRPDGVILYANEWSAKLLGHDRPEEIIGHPRNILVNDYAYYDMQGNLVPQESLPFAQALRGMPTQHMILRMKNTVSMEERWLDANAQPVFTADGAIAYIIGVTRNITSEKLAELQLQESNARLEFLAEISGTLASSINYHETLKAIAARMVPSMADWAAIDMLNEDRTVERLAVVHVDPDKISLAYEIQREFPYDPDAQTGLAKVLRTGMTEYTPLVTRELIVESVPEGRLRELVDQLHFSSVIIVPLVARGRILGALTLVMAESERHYTRADVTFAEDIARRAAAAVDNALLYKESQDALALRDDFLSIASHELKTPVTSIKAFLQAMENRMHEPAKFDFTKNRQYMQLSVKQVDRLAAIINDLLDINRINKGKMEYHFKKLSIGPVLSDAIERMSVSFPTHKLHMKLEELTAKVNLDELRFEQVLTNLITNAAKYSPEDSTIDIVTHSDDRSIYIDIIDRGMGISEEDQEMIFTRYYRTAQAVDSRVSGLGVGLYISHQLIEAHGGSLTVRSHLGQGSTFTITLPRAEAAR